MKYYTIQQLAKELKKTPFEAFMLTLYKDYHFIQTAKGNRYIMKTDKQLDEKREALKAQRYLERVAADGLFPF